jgi:hypothetical protein
MPGPAGKKIGLSEIVTVAVGFVLIGISYYFANGLQDNDLKKYLTVIVVALGAGCIGSILPGLLSINTHGVKATSALALALIAGFFGYKVIFAGSDDPGFDSIKNVLDLNPKVAEDKLDQYESGLKNGTRDARQKAVLKLLNLIKQTRYYHAQEVIDDNVREIRSYIFKVIIDLDVSTSETFQDGELEGLDLVNIDFHSLNFRRAHFDGSFLIETNFDGATLDGASFDGAYIRNVNFHGATLRAVSFKNADWFNALGLEKDQLKECKVDTLMFFPDSRAKRFKYLADHYGIPYDNWTPDIQNEILDAWRTYSRKGGLADAVKTWNRSH